VTVVKVYFANEGQIQVHQQKVCQCPPELLAGYYWYGKHQRSMGSTHRWVEDLQTMLNSEQEDPNTAVNCNYDNAEVDKNEDLTDNDNVMEDYEEEEMDEEDEAPWPELVVHN